VSKTRLETFSDGVIAILITIMVLELRPPDHSAVDPYHDLTHAISSYILSFVVLAIYWNNHRHMMQLCTRVNGRILWANMNLLFWLSLIPFATAWISDPAGLTSHSAAVSERGTWAWTLGDLSDSGTSVNGRAPAAAERPLMFPRHQQWRPLVLRRRERLDLSAAVIADHAIARSPIHFIPDLADAVEKRDAQRHEKRLRYRPSSHVAHYGGNLTVTIIRYGKGTPSIRPGRYSHFMMESITAWSRSGIDRKTSA
jgi:hypothetical protein